MFRRSNVQPCQRQSNLDATLEFALRDFRECADHRIFWLLVSQWGFVLVGGFVASILNLEFKFDSMAALMIGAGILTALPMFVMLSAPASWQSRWSVTVCQGCFSSLLWCVTEANPQVYLHLLAWIFAISWCCDVRCLLAVSVIALTGNAVACATGQVPGFTLDDQSFTHTVSLIGMIAETAILACLVQYERQSLRATFRRDIEASVQHAELKQAYDHSVSELAIERDNLYKELAIANDRSNAAEAQRSFALKELESLRDELGRSGDTIVNLASRQVDSELPEDWRDHSQSIRREAQKLMHRVDLPSLLTTSDRTVQRSGELAGSIVESASDQSEPVAETPRFDRRALIVVSDPNQQVASTSALNAIGYKVDTATTGPEAYYMAILNEYDAILVDVDLPKEEGYDVVEAIRELPPDSFCETVDVFALTSVLTPDRIMRSTAAGVDGILIKPLKEDSLRQTLTRRPAVTSGSRSNACWSWSGAGLAR